MVIRLSLIAGAMLASVSSACSAPIENDETAAASPQTLIESCKLAGRSDAACACYASVMTTELKPDELAFFVDVIERQMASQSDPEIGAALARDISSPQDYYREKLAPANAAAQKATRMCKDVQ